MKSEKSFFMRRFFVIIGYKEKLSDDSRKRGKNETTYFAE